MPRTAADDVVLPSTLPPPHQLLAVMLRCAFMQLSVMCCIHFTIMLRLVAAAAACGAVCLCYCFCCGAKRCSLSCFFFCFASAIVVAVFVVLFVVIISVLRELPLQPFLLAPFLLVSVAFWYLTFIWNCHARCWLPAAPALPLLFLHSPPFDCAESPFPAQRLCWLQRSSCGPVAAYCLLNWMTEWRKGQAHKQLPTIQKEGKGAAEGGGAYPNSLRGCLATLTICAFIHSFSTRCHRHFIMFIISCWSVNSNRRLSEGASGRHTVGRGVREAKPTEVS